jgi:ABC-type bacteriocin/lantibiotic exporter with double-glycine peptidase domain
MQIISIHSKKIYGLCALITFLNLLSNVILLAYTTRVREVVDSVIQKNFQILLNNLILFFVLFVIMLGLNWINMKIVRWAKFKITYEMRDEFLHHLNSIHMYNFDDYGKNNISNRYTDELNRIIGFYIESLPNIIKDITLLILICIYAYTQNVFLFLAIICVCIVVYLCSIRTGKKIGALSEKAVNLDINRNTTEYDIISSKMELKCFGVFDFISAKVKDAEEDYRVNDYKLVRCNRYLWGLYIVTFSIISTIILSVGAILALNGYITFGSITSFLVILDPIVSSIFSAYGVIAIFMDIRPIIKRFNEWQLLDEEKEFTKPDAINEGDHLFELKYFGYKYNNEKSSDYLIDDVNFTIKHGEKYLITGKSGLGKSTLIKIMTGYDDRYRGSLKFEGIELSELGGPFIRGQVVYIGDDMYLFSGSIKEIFTMVYKDISDDEIKKYLDVVELPFLLDQVIDKNGSSISGGEKQRLCLALSLVSKKNIMMMDECISMVPFEQQLRIMKRIFENPDTTCFWVDHRVLPEIFELFDKIIFFDEDKKLHCENYFEISKNESFKSLLLNGRYIDA